MCDTVKQLTAFNPETLRDRHQSDQMVSMYTKDLHNMLSKLSSIKYFASFQQVKTVLINLYERQFFLNAAVQSCPAELLSWVNKCPAASHKSLQRCFLGHERHFFGQWGSHEKTIGNRRDCCVKLLDSESTTGVQIESGDLYLKDLRQWNHCRPKRFIVFPQRAVYKICLQTGNVKIIPPFKLGQIIILLQHF